MTNEELLLSRKLTELVFKSRNIKDEPNENNILATFLVLDNYRSQSDISIRNYFILKDRLLNDYTYQKLSEIYGTTLGNIRRIVARMLVMFESTRWNWKFIGDVIVKGIKDGDVIDDNYLFISETAKKHGINLIVQDDNEYDINNLDNPHIYSELESLGLSTRVYNSLRRAGINTIDEAEEQMNTRYIRGLGEKSKTELKEVIEKYKEKHKGE